MKAIQASELTRDYDGLRAVDGITFTVETGEIFGFLGPNGAGKTTTIKVLTGQLRPTAGTAQVAGCDVVEERQQLKPKIGVVFEYQNLYERLSARDNLVFAARLYGVPKAPRGPGSGPGGTHRPGAGPDKGVLKRHEAAAACRPRPAS